MESGPNWLTKTIKSSINITALPLKIELISLLFVMFYLSAIVVYVSVCPLYIYIG